MKPFKFIALAAPFSLLCNLSAYAGEAPSRYYAGIQAGIGTSNINDRNSVLYAASSITTSTPRYSKSTSGFAGRVYAGNKVNNSLSVEVGYTKYSNADSTTSGQFFNQTLSGRATLKTSSFDLLGVYTLPVTHRLSANLKGGFAYVLSEYNLSLTVPGTQIASINRHSRSIQPKLGASTDYLITDNIALGVSYDVTTGTGRPFDINTNSLGSNIYSNNDYSPLLQTLSVDVKYIF